MFHRCCPDVLDPVISFHAWRFRMQAEGILRGVRDSERLVAEIEDAMRQELESYVAPQGKPVRRGILRRMIAWIGRG